MTVFCPNCGKPNMDTAVKCVACGHDLKPAAGGSKAKFKGTMMMTAATPGGPGGTGPQPGPGSAGAPVPAPSSGVPAPTPTPTPAPVAPPVAGGGQNLGFQATMLGPMPAVGGTPVGGSPGPAGAPAPAAAQAPSPISNKPTGGFGAPAPAPAPVGAPSPGFGASPAAGFGPPASSAGGGASPAAGGSAFGAAGGAMTPPSSGGFGGGGTGGMEPHRGTMLLVASVASLLCCQLGSIVVFFLARGDKQKIATGAMDPEGASSTNIAYWVSVAGMVVFVLIFCLSAVSVGMQIMTAG